MERSLEKLADWLCSEEYSVESRQEPLLWQVHGMNCHTCVGQTSQRLHRIFWLKTQAESSRETCFPMFLFFFAFQYRADCHTRVLYCQWMEFFPPVKTPERICGLKKSNRQSWVVKKQHVPYGELSWKCNQLKSLYCNFVMTLLQGPSVTTTNCTTLSFLHQQLRLTH